MRIGRTDSGFWAGDATGWVAVSSLGVDAPDLPTVVAQADAFRGARRPGPTQSDLDGTLMCPVVRPGAVLAIGLNYRDFIREAGMTAPERPMVFAKYPNSLTGPFSPIVVEPDLTVEADYEAELAVIIGTRCRRIGVDDALDHVFGYAVANDVSARDWGRIDPQLSRSKSFDTFCPIGPWITTADEIPDPQDLLIRTFVNGESVQDSTTAEMVFGVAEIISFLSQTITLVPGDVILTGTPHGIGLLADPPRFLGPGDVVRIEIDGLGAIENPVVDRR